MAYITWIHKWILFLIAILSVGADIFPTRKNTNISLSLPQSLLYKDLMSHITYYERCHDTVFNVAHFYCGKNEVGLPEMKSCSNLCGDPADDLECMEKCPIHRECMLGSSGQSEELCAKFFIFTLHEDVLRMNAPNTTTPDPVTTSEAGNDTRLECPVPKDCKSEPIDCDKCPKSAEIPETSTSAKVVEYDGKTEVDDSDCATEEGLKKQFSYFLYAIISLLLPANVGLILFGLIRLYRGLYGKRTLQNNGRNSRDVEENEEGTALNGVENNDGYTNSTNGVQGSRV